MTGVALRIQSTHLVALLLPEILWCHRPLYLLSLSNVVEGVPYNGVLNPRPEVPIAKYFVPSHFVDFNEQMARVRIVAREKEKGDLALYYTKKIMAFQNIKIKKFDVNSMNLWKIVFLTRS